MPSITSWGCLPSTVHPTDWAVPRTSLTVPASVLASDLEASFREIYKAQRCQTAPLPETRSLPSRLTSTISSNATFPLCLMFFSFFLSRGGSFRALMTMDEAEGTTETAACRFWIVSWTVTRRPFQSPVALAMSSPTFLGDYRSDRTQISVRRLLSLFWHHPPLTRPKGPILGAKAADEPTSPPTARR